MKLFSDLKNYFKPITNPNPAEKVSTTPKKEYTAEEKKDAERKIQLIVGGLIGGGLVCAYIPNLLSNYQICLNKIVPSFLQKSVEINQFVLALFQTPVLLLPAPLIEPAIIMGTAPIVEELECRYLFQYVLLNKMSRRIVSKFASQHLPLLDSNAAKVARATLSTLLFALLHLTRAGDHEDQCLGANYGFAVLALGAVNGAVMELTGNVKACILIHMINNAWGYATRGTALKA